MKTVTVELKNNSYPIKIGKTILDRLPGEIGLLKTGKDAVLITDSRVAKLHAKNVASIIKSKGFTVKIFSVPEGEKSKSASDAMRLIEDIARYDTNKNIFIMALGGGVIGDLAGFVAAIYKRGVAYIQVPTTLLAQIDSAIGGKVAIDLTVGKNLAGAYYHPKMVFSDVQFLKTLNLRQIRNGLAEAVKYGAILDLRLFQFIENNVQKLLNQDTQALSVMVNDCSRIKAEVVSKDEKESLGLRTVLNFGHTLGHAIENAGSYDQYHHGEAIALGMRMAAFISCAMGMLSAKESDRLNQLLSNIGLPQVIEKISESKILSAMSHDKKFIAGRNRFVLLQKIGKAKVVSGVPSSLISQAIRKFSAKA